VRNLVGSHRRQRASPHPGRGAAWTGLFLALAVVAVVATKGLWTELMASVLNLGPVSAPQGSVLWQAPCSPEAVCAVNSAGKVLLAVSAPGEGSDAGVAGSGGGAETSLFAVENGKTTVISRESGTTLAMAFFDLNLTGPLDGVARSEDDWRAVTVRSSDSRSSDPGSSDEVETEPHEDVLCREPGLGQAQRFQTKGDIVTAACSWVEEANLLLGAFSMGFSDDPKGLVIGVGPNGEELWSRPIGEKPVHRLATRPGTGLIAAATPDTIALLDGKGNLLWSKTLRTQITDLAVYSKGGPVVVAGGTLLVYDRRGNLIWKKSGRTLLSAVACAGQRIAVAGDAGVVVYDEDGLEKWILTCAGRPGDIALDPEGLLLAAVLESGAVILAQAPGTATTD
jgi:hypothetical protein